MRESMRRSFGRAHCGAWNKRCMPATIVCPQIVTNICIGQTIFPPIGVLEPRNDIPTDRRKQTKWKFC